MIEPKETPNPTWAHSHIQNQSWFLVGFQFGAALYLSKLLNSASLPRLTLILHPYRVFQTKSTRPATVRSGLILPACEGTDPVCVKGIQKKEKIIYI